MNNININLTEEQIQRMVIILGNAPYKDVADIIDEIKVQVNEALKKSNDSDCEVM